MNRFFKAFVCMALAFVFARNPVWASDVSADLPEKTVEARAGATSTQLQELLNENADGKYRLTVKIPAGTYPMDATLFVYPNTTIQAAGATLVKESTYGVMLEAKLSRDDGGYDGNHDIVIDGGKWDSSPLQKNSAGTETFRFIHCSGITIKNAQLCNVPESSHLIVLAGVRDAVISNCKFYGYGADWNKAQKQKEAVQLDAVHSAKEVPTSQEGEILNWDDLTCDQVSITDCEFYNFSRGIGSHTAVAGRFHTNITIKNNNFHDLADSAIRMYNYKDAVVSGNTIKNAAVGILAYTFIEISDENAYFEPNDGKIGTMPSDYNIKIENNHIQDLKAKNNNWGDGIRIIGGETDPSRAFPGVSITGNTIRSAARYGIFATAAPGIAVSGGNCVSDVKSDGILVLESNGASVSGNAVTNVPGVGIRASQSKDCEIGSDSSNYNTIQSTGEQGIYVTTGCDGAKILYNRISGAKKDGIGVSASSQIAVEGNSLSAQGNGIKVISKSKSARISNNTVTSARASGIWLATQCSASVIENNIIKKYGKSGNYSAIYVLKSGGTSAKKPTKIVKNTIAGTYKRTKNPGIKISGSANTVIESNQIKSAQGTGIYAIESKKCTVRKNQVISAKERGIYLTGKCDGAKIISNTVKKAAGVSISMYRAPKSLIKNNTITGKRTQRGIWVSQSDKTKIQSNKVNGAKKRQEIVVTGSSGCKKVRNKVK